MAIKDGDCLKTPPWFIECVQAVGPIVLDPCASSTGKQLPAAEHYTIEDDGLTKRWTTEGLIYVNPPYSRGNLPMWMNYICGQAARGCEIIVLIPSRTGERWFAETVFGHAQALCFLCPRIAFVDPTTELITGGGGRFSSAAVYYGANSERFFAAFRDHGELMKISPGG